MVSVYPWISLIFDIDVYFRLRPAHRPGSTAISELEQFSSKRTSSCLPVNPCSPFRRNYHQVLVLHLRLRQVCSHPSLIKEHGVAFVHLDDVDSSKPELATELSRARYLVSHEFVTKMKEKFREMTLKWMAAEKEVCAVHVGHRCFIKSYQCSQPTLTVPFAIILWMTPSSRLASFFRI